MSKFTEAITFGPFHDARVRCDQFCHNMFLSNAIHECAIKLQKLEEQHEVALADGDEQQVAIIAAQVKAFKSSLMLTAHMFDEIDEITT